MSDKTSVVHLVTNLVEAGNYRLAKDFVDAYETFLYKIYFHDEEFIDNNLVEVRKAQEILKANVRKENYNREVYARLQKEALDMLDGMEACTELYDQAMEMAQNCIRPYTV